MSQYSNYIDAFPRDIKYVIVDFFQRFSYSET